MRPLSVGVAGLRCKSKNELCTNGKGRHVWNVLIIYSGFVYSVFLFISSIIYLFVCLIVFSFFFLSSVFHYFLDHSSTHTHTSTLSISLSLSHTYIYIQTNQHSGINYSYSMYIASFLSSACVRKGCGMEVFFEKDVIICCYIFCLLAYDRRYLNLYKLQL